MSNDGANGAGAPPGRVVILNGTSSAGKSTLAAAFRDARAAAGEPWLVIGIDDFLATLPVEWFEGDGHVGEHSAAGVRFEPRGDALVVVCLGELGQRWLDAYRRCVAACAWSGLDVIVDDVALDKRAVDDWVQVLSGLQVTWVAVHCDVDVAEARERERGDRIIGLARGQHPTVHRWISYDGELDTTSTAMDGSLARLIDIVDGTA